MATDHDGDAIGPAAGAFGSGAHLDHRTRYSNFDFIRVLAATSVIFSHSFPIAEGTEKNEPFIPWLGAIVGIYGVYIFLMMSGFLVSRSLVTSASITAYLWKRALRVVPALIVGALVSAVVLACFYSEIGPWNYLLSEFGYRYAIKAVLLLPVSNIETVSFYEGGWGAEVNGVLWTIQQEVFLYILLACLAALGLFRPATAVVLVVLGYTLFLFKAYLPSGFVENLAYALPSFSAGVIVYFVWRRHRFNPLIALSCAALMVCGFAFGVLEYVFPLPGAYLILWLATSETVMMPNLARWGDVSYGTYLYGWPIQQTVRSHLGEGASPWLLFAISLPLALCCGWLSWHLVEKRALRLKRLDPVALALAMREQVRLGRSR